MVKRHRVVSLSAAAFWCSLVTVLLVAVLVGPAYAQEDFVPDTENCLLCHRYPSIGRYDESGKKKVYYVNDESYARSVHGKLRCTNCHIGLDQIPHTDLEPVDCATECHLTDPSTNDDFSHRVAVEKFEESVHGANHSGTEVRHTEDLPTCKYCHDNRILTPKPGTWGRSDALSGETLARCKGCHTDDQWAERAFAHLTHRMRRRRDQSEVVALCTTCHEDGEKMARHGLESIETFKDTFHWVQVKYGVADAPDCISCHVPVGYSAHDIRQSSDPINPINPEMRVQTCSNAGGVQTCHPNATEQFAKGRVHAYGRKAELAASRQGITEVDFLEGLSPEEMTLFLDQKKGMEGDELFHYQVIKTLKLIYKFLIGMVIGPMILHQMLDYYRTKKSHHS